MNTLKTISMEAYQYGIFFMTYAVVLSATIMFFNNADIMKTFSYSTLGFVVFSVMSITIASVYYSPLLKDKTPNMTITYLAAGLIMFASIISSVFAFATPQRIREIGIAFLFLSGITLLLLLTLFFYIYGNYLTQNRGIVGFIIKFIFFIPCMLLDFIEYIKNQYNISTRTEWIILIIEILFIIAYFTINPIVNRLLNKNIIYILNQPVFLNKKTIALSDTTSLAMVSSITSNINNDLIMPANFSISMWVYLNVQTNSFMRDDGSSYEVNIFSYGNGKPKINYTNNIVDNTVRDVYLFYFTDSANSSNYKKTLPGQKWNNIVFNYNGNIVDLFINGILETSFTFDNVNNIMPTFSTNDSITTGFNNGLNGAICNITYKNSNLENHQIVSNYNLLMLKNPPLLHNL
jgi:hypothetical protein